MLDIAEGYFEKAETLRTKKWQPEKAVKEYDKALDIYPRHVAAALGKAQALLAMSDADGAISLLDKLTEEEPADYRAPYELGRFFLSCGDYSNALDRLLVALDRNANVPEVHESLAEIYEAVEDDKSARQHREIAAKLRS